MTETYLSEFYKTSTEFKLAERVCERLTESGHLAYLAGGCVRDFYLKRAANDFDVATNARPEQVQELFPKTIDIGKKFGVIIVVEDHKQVEVTTFRSDLAYVNGRQPTEVVFTTPEEDAERRDFTMNALFYDLKHHRVLDFVGGLSDLQQKNIRAVGIAKDRFQEDHLRILRALRFVSQLGFAIEASTWEAVQSQSSALRSLSAERVFIEFDKLLQGPFRENSLKLCAQAGVLKLFFSEGGLLKDHCGFFVAQDLQESFRAWSLFFFLQELPFSEVDAVMAQFRMSKKLQKQIHEALAVFAMKDQDLGDEAIGQTMEALFTESAEWASQHRQSYFASSSLAEILKLKKKLWGNFKPEPVVHFKDLPESFQGAGAQAGRLLRRCYLLQLAGIASSKQDLLAKVLSS